MVKVKGETRNSSTSSGQIYSKVRQSDKVHNRLLSSQARFGVAILEKLTALEELFKKWESMLSAKDDRPLTFKEACSYLGYAPSYLYKLTYKNVIPHYKPTGKMIFFSKNEVDQWIFKSSHKAQGTSNEVTECLSARVEKDPNQMEMELESEDEKRKTEEKYSSATLGMTKETDASQIHSLNSGQGSAQELLIEFPLKSRRKK